MKIIYRYILKEFLKPFFFSAAAFGCLVMISEFFRELSFYLENKTSFLTVFYYLLLNLPWWIIQVLPVSVLLAVLFSLGALAKTNEITAIKAAGINLWRVVSMLFVVALLIGGTEVFLREVVIPPAVRKAEAVRREKIHKERPASTQTEYFNLLVALPDNGRMTIGYLNTSSNTIRGIIIDYYNDDAVPVRQIVAKSGTGKGRRWMLNDGVERIFAPVGSEEADSAKDAVGVVKETPFYHKVVRLPLQPKDFVINKLRPEQMPTGEFLAYLHQLDALGIPSEKEQIQFQLRWSSVFNHLIVMLIGIPFALGLGGKYGKFISFTFALLFAFVYWGILAVGQSLGESKLISPLLAAWMGNILFGIIGLSLVAKLKK